MRWFCLHVYRALSSLPAGRHKTMHKTDRPTPGNLQCGLPLMGYNNSWAQPRCYDCLVHALSITRSLDRKMALKAWKAVEMSETVMTTYWMNAGGWVLGSHWEEWVPRRKARQAAPVLARPHTTPLHVTIATSQLAAAAAEHELSTRLSIAGRQVRSAHWTTTSLCSATYVHWQSGTARIRPPLLQH